MSCEISNMVEHIKTISCPSTESENKTHKNIFHIHKPQNRENLPPGENKPLYLTEYHTEFELLV